MHGALYVLIAAVCLGAVVCAASVDLTSAESTAQTAKVEETNDQINDKQTPVPEAALDIPGGIPGSAPSEIGSLADGSDSSGTNNVKGNGTNYEDATPPTEALAGAKTDGEPKDVEAGPQPGSRTGDSSKKDPLSGGSKGGKMPSREVAETVHSGPVTVIPRERNTDSRVPDHFTKLNDGGQANKNTDDGIPLPKIHVKDEEASHGTSGEQHGTLQEKEHDSLPGEPGKGLQRPNIQRENAGDLPISRENGRHTAISKSSESNAQSATSLKLKHVDDAHSETPSQPQNKRKQTPQQESFTSKETSSQFPAKHKATAHAKPPTVPLPDADKKVDSTTKVMENDITSSVDRKKTLTPPKLTLPHGSDALPIPPSVDKTDFSLCSSSLFALAALATLAVAAAAPAH